MTTNKRTLYLVTLPLLFLFALVLPTQQAHASELVPDWTQNHGGFQSDVFYDSTVTADGEYIIMVGETRSSTFGALQGITDALVVCVDKEGNLIWARNFGGPERSAFESVEVKGNYIYVAGNAQAASTNLSPNNWEHVGDTSMPDAIVVKLNLQDGSVVWSNNYGGIGYDYFNALVATEDALYAAGHAFGPSTNLPINWGFLGDYDAILVKIDFDTGAAIWGKNYGGTGEERFYSATVIDNHLYAAGFSSDASTNIPSGNWANEGNANWNDAILVKIDLTTEEALWGKNYGGLSDDYFRAIASADGELYASGYSYGASTNVSPGWSNEGSSDGIVVRIDPSGGEVLWSNNYGGSQNETLFDIAISNDAVYAVGTSMSSSANFTPSWGNEGASDAVALKIDSQDGRVLGANNYGGASGDYFCSVDQMADGSVFAAGYSSSQSTNLSPHDWDNAGANDGILVKLSEFYTCTLTGGTDNTNQAPYAAGSTISIAANAAPAGQVFDKWVLTSGTGTLADASSTTTTFTFASRDAVLTASFKPIAGPTNDDNGLAKTADGTAPLGSAAIIILVVALVLFTSAQLGRSSKIRKQN